MYISDFLIRSEVARLMTQPRLLGAFLLVAAVALFARAAARRDGPGMVDRQLTIGPATYNYKVFVPANWTKKKKWPVILFLHGGGERGDDNTAQARVGIGPVIEKMKAELNAVVVLPQCPRARWWSEPEMQALALQAFDAASAEFKGDRLRSYLTGLSMGGYGTWSIVKSQPGKFAALAVVCGGARRPASVPAPPGTPPEDPNVDPYKAVADKVGKTPVWVFHGAADPVVPPSESRKMVEALKAAGADVRYSEYEGVGHNSWDNAYAEPEFFKWMLSRKLKKTK
jgi:predicted peptidase